jgi:hypothetical protein
MNDHTASKITICLIAFLFFSGSSGIGQGREKLVSLSGDWRFSIGDNMKYARPDFDDADWEKIYVPADWNRQGFRNYNGYAWYRRKVVIEGTTTGALYLELGKIDDVDEVYFNGHFIGRTGTFPPDYVTACNYPRKYYIPAEYINKNAKNVIAVRVFDEGGQGGIMGYSSAMGIYSYSNYSQNSLTLMGKWKFRLGDDKAWAAESVSETGWEDILVPATWESQGFANYDGYAWYRNSIKLPDNFKIDDLVIMLGRIDDMDEVYINGKKVGYTGRIDEQLPHDDEWRKVRTYTVPDGLLKPGRYNTIAVRVYDHTGAGGIYEGPLALLPKNEYKEFWKNYKTGNSTEESFLSWLSYYFED